MDVSLTKASVLRWVTTPVARALRRSGSSGVIAAGAETPSATSTAPASVITAQGEGEKWPDTDADNVEDDMTALSSAESAASPLPAFVQRLKERYWDDYDRRFILVVCGIRFFVMPVVMAMTAVAIGLRPDHSPPLPVTANNIATMSVVGGGGGVADANATLPIQFSSPGMIVDKPRILALVCMLESFTPAAMNAVLICAMYSYKTSEMSFMLLIHYIISLGTSSIWLSYALWFLEP